MAGDRQVRRQASRLEKAAVELQAAFAEFERQQRIVQTALDDSEIKPFPDAPKDQRYKTVQEYATEYADPKTTPLRRLEMLAIRAGLLPPETVASPQVAPPVLTPTVLC